jgi:hypothetical protein
VLLENTQLPAGNYTIVPNEDVEPILDMRNPQKDINILVLAETEHSVMNPGKSELLFLTKSEELRSGNGQGLF